MSRRVVGGIAVGLVIAAAVATSPARAIAVFERIAGDPVVLLVALCVAAVVRPFLAWPVSLLGGVAGYGYGVVGFPLGLGVMTVTAVPPYLLGKRGRESVGNGRLAAVTDRFTNAGERMTSVAGPTRAVAAARFAPVPSDAVSVAAGTVRVPLGPFLLGTAIGEAPWAAAAVLAGVSANAITTDGVTAAFSLELVAALLGVAAALLVGPLVRLYRGES